MNMRQFLIHLFHRRTIEVLSVLFISVPICSVHAQFGLSFSGKSSWDASSGTLTFESNGAMPDTLEGFYWLVPAEVKKVVIAADVTVTGAFRVPFRTVSNPLYIVGVDRQTSVIFGTGTEKWTSKNEIAENDKWKYGAINVLADAIVYVTNLTSMNPRSYNISGYAHKSVIHVSCCNLLDTRKSDNNNSDGFIGAAGSSICDSLISTSDDGIKIYHDITIRNVTIEQHRNGAPIQFGWGGEKADVKAVIENLTITGVDPEHRYNMAPFTWVDGTTGSRNVSITGLKVNLEGKMFNDDDKRWQPAGLFALRPKACTLNLTIINADIKTPDTGFYHTKGSILINGKPLSMENDNDTVQNQLLQSARQLLDSGKPEEAVKSGIDPVIKYYEEKSDGDG
jgi:hypothetical protein